MIRSDDSAHHVPLSRFHLDRLFHAPEWLHLGLQSRWRYESYSQPVRKNEATGGAQFSGQTLAQIGVRYDLLRLFTEFIDARPIYNYGLTVNNKMEDRTDVLQMYVGFGTDHFLGSDVPTELQIGKFTQDFGSRRLISWVAYNNVPNSFVGAHWTLGRQTAWNLRTFVMRPVKNQQTSPDRTETNTVLTGIAYQDRRISWLHTEVYVYYTSQNDRAPGSAGIQEDESTHGERQNLYSPGIRFFKPAAVGSIDYEVESIYQFGKSALQTGGTLVGGEPLPVFAFYQHGEVGYTFMLPWRPAARIAYDYASGDKDPNDRKNGRFDSLYGARNFDFTHTGIWSLFSRSNISSPGYFLTAHPTDEVKLSFKQRFYWLAEARDEFIGASLQDRSGRSGRYLGSELDLRFAWTASSNLLVEGGWVYLIKGAYYSNLLREGIAGSPNDRNTDYVFISMRLLF